MANRRMISKSISVSEQVNNMSLFSRLLFTWMIAHADDFGRMPGSPAKVRALVVPMSTETVDDVASALQEMVDNDLIIWYEVDGVQYIQFKKWEKHQTGLHKRTESQIPPPPDAHAEVPVISLNFPETPGTSDDIPADSRKFREVPGISRSRELELEQEQEQEPKDNLRGDKKESAYKAQRETSAPKEMPLSSSLDPDFGKIARMYEDEGFGQLTETVSQDLGEMYDEFGLQWVVEAMKEAVRQNKKRLKYVRAILQNWRADGGMRTGPPPASAKTNRQGGMNRGRDRPSDRERLEQEYAFWNDLSF